MTEINGRKMTSTTEENSHNGRDRWPQWPTKTATMAETDDLNYRRKQPQWPRQMASMADKNSHNGRDTETKTCKIKPLSILK